MWCAPNLYRSTQVKVQERLIDVIATERFYAQIGEDWKGQRIPLELLDQVDGFDHTTNVKVIMATNTNKLDPALLHYYRVVVLIVKYNYTCLILFCTINGR